jgi:hypothetical protein
VVHSAIRHRRPATGRDAASLPRPGGPSGTAALELTIMPPRCGRWPVGGESMGSSSHDNRSTRTLGRMSGYTSLAECGPARFVASRHCIRELGRPGREVELLGRHQLRTSLARCRYFHQGADSCCSIAAATRSGRSNPHRILEETTGRPAPCALVGGSRLYARSQTSSDWNPSVCGRRSEPLTSSCQRTAATRSETGALSICAAQRLYKMPPTPTVFCLLRSWLRPVCALFLQIPHGGRYSRIPSRTINHRLERRMQRRSNRPAPMSVEASRKYRLRAPEWAAP